MIICLFFGQRGLWSIINLAYNNYLFNDNSTINFYEFKNANIFKSDGAYNKLISRIKRRLLDVIASNTKTTGPNFMLHTDFDWREMKRCIDALIGTLTYLDSPEDIPWLEIEMTFRALGYPGLCGIIDLHYYNMGKGRTCLVERVHSFLQQSGRLV